MGCTCPTWGGLLLPSATSGWVALAESNHAALTWSHPADATHLNQSHPADATHLDQSHPADATYWEELLADATYGYATHGYPTAKNRSQSYLKLVSQTNRLVFACVR
ncbi:MAG: hypothetical protein SFV81_04770 [Pirellulaceae bacterium]|nr:hypothetical protein [Pirellulaceae bacterium]